jgi:O-antigen ligase
VATGQAPLRWGPAYWLLVAYFCAMALSGLQDFRAALPKLASQAYLLGLPVLVDQLIRSERALKAAVLTWLAATATVAIVGLVSLVLFAWDPAHPLLGYVRFHFGTLAPGHYPRLRLTFVNANMLCNYLTAGLCLALAARHLHWLKRSAFWWLVGGIGIAATFTISPGLAGIAFAIGVWLWLVWRDRHRGLARLSLVAGLGAALLSVPVMALTPILHPTAPFLVPVPATDLILAPAGRLMIWIDAVRNFVADPFLGRGIGQDAVLVFYQDPEGDLQRLTDAHNSFLSIAVQCGIAGFTALIAILAGTVRLMGPLRLSDDRANTLRLAFGMAFLNGLALQGLGGSFEDARHLWVLFGLLLAAERIERSA